MQWQRIWHRWFFIVFFMLAAACGRAPNSSTATSAEVAAVSTVTPQSSPTLSPSPTPTLTPTPSPTTTQPPSPTPTPTPALPVYLATPFPWQLQAITTENISRLRELAYYGSPAIEGFQITRDGKLGFVMTSVGVAVYDMVTKQWKGLYGAVFCTGGSSSCGNDALVLSSDGSRFAILAKDSVQVWDLDSNLIFEVPLVSLVPYLNNVAISPDGKLLAVHDDKVVIYDIESGQELSGLPVFQYKEFVFSPDGSYFVEWRACSNCASKGTIWRVSDWSRVRAFSFGLYGEVRGFSPDGRLVALQDNDQIAVYQIEDWRLKRQIKVHSDKARQTKGVEFSLSGEKISVWESIFNFSTLTSIKLVRVWDIPTGEQLSEAEPPEGMRLFSVGDDGVVIPHLMPTGMCDGLGLICSAVPRSFEYNDTQFQFQMMAASEGRFEACTVQPGATQTCLESLESTFLNTDGQFYIVRRTEEPDTYAVRRGADGGGPVLEKFRSQAQFINPRWLSADGRLLLFSSSATEELWDIQQETRIKKWPDSIRHFSVSRDGSLLALVFWNGQQVVYHVEQNRVLYSSNALFWWLHAPLAFTETGDLISIETSSQNRPNTDSTEYVFDFNMVELETLKRTPIIRIVQNESYLDAIATSPDGSLLAVGMPDGTIRVFDMNTKQEVYAWQAHAGGVTQLEFSADGSLVRVRKPVGREHASSLT